MRFPDFIQIAHTVWEQLRTVLIIVFNGLHLRGGVFLQTQLLCVLREVLMILHICNLTIKAVI